MKKKPNKSIPLLAADPVRVDPEAYRRNRTYRDVILIVAHEIWNRPATQPK